MKLILIVLLSVFSVVKVTEQSELICSRQPIVALPGDDVILPCRLEPAANAASWRVEWTKPDLNPEHIHVHEDGRLFYEIQNPSYNYRTRLFVDELMNGNVSIKIFRVKLSDGGKYRCFIPSIQKEAFVQLTVEEPKMIGSDQPIRAAVGDDVVLPCFLKPPINVMTRRVDWKRNERFAHVYRSRADDLSLQDENFRSRTSLFHDEMAKGNISLKLTNVTEEDAGNYTCIVAKVNDQIISGSFHLILDPMREGEESKGADNSSSGAIIAAVLCPLAFVGIGLFVLWWKCRETSQRRDGRESSSQNLEDLRARLSNVETLTLLLDQPTPQICVTIYK